MQLMTHDYLWLLVVTGTWLDYDFPIILGMSSSHLTNSMIFQRGRDTTNQIATRAVGCFGDH